MAFRFALAFALISVAVSIAVPIHDYEQHNDSPAEYDFSYAVNDHSTGDIKSHQESRKGHAVTGKYELIDSDGYRRIVEYTADEHTGFNAVVRREPTDIKIPTFESHYSHEPSAHHYSHSNAPVEHNTVSLQHAYVAPKVANKVTVVPVQQKAYVAPKVAKKIVEPVKAVPIKVTESEHHEPHLLQVKYVAPSAKVVKHTKLNTHVSYTAPDFNYHY